MPRVHRFTAQSAAGIVLQQAQQAGLPAQNPQIQAAIGQMLVLMYQNGIFLAVDDTSPFFEQLRQLAGRTQTTRMPAAPGGNGHMAAPPVQAYPYSMPMPPAPQQPMQQPMPQQPPQQPQQPPHVNPWAQVPAGGAVDPRTGRPFPVAGQPLAEMNPPPPLVAPIAGAMPVVTNPRLPQPIQQIAPHEVPLAAPVYGAGPALVAPVMRRPAPMAPVRPIAAAPIPAGAPVADTPPSMTMMSSETAAQPPGPPMAG